MSFSCTTSFDLLVRKRQLLDRPGGAEGTRG